MVLDSVDAEDLVDLSYLAQKISLPGMGQGDQRLTCFTDDDGTSKCFTQEDGNKLSCNETSCFVNYKTLSQRLLGNGKKIKDLNLDVLIRPSGISTTIQLVGTIPKKKLRTLEKIIGKVDVEEVSTLPSISIGIPRPPANCHLNPLNPECSKYLSSDDYVFIPMIGFKKRNDIMSHPGTVFKSEVIPQLKKMVNDFMGAIKLRKKSGDDNKTIDESPMHSKETRDGKIEKKVPVHL